MSLQSPHLISERTSPQQAICPEKRERISASGRGMRKSRSRVGGERLRKRTQSPGEQKTFAGVQHGGSQEGQAAALTVTFSGYWTGGSPVGVWVPLSLEELGQR